MAQSHEWPQLIESLPLPNKPTTLKIGREINRGSWGTVYDGEFNRRAVAVKAIHRHLCNSEEGETAIRKLCKECDTLKELEHDHVISECLAALS